jgi:WD40 repeat protein
MQTPLDLNACHIAEDLTHDRPLITCRFDPLGKFAYASSEGYSIVRWDLEKKAKSSLDENAHETWVLALAFTPDSKTMFSGGGDGRLIWWPEPGASEPPKPSRTVVAHSGWINSIAASADGQWIASAGNDRMVRVWSAADGSPIAEFPGHERPVYRVAFLPGGKFLLTADLLGRVVQWEIATRKEVRRLDAAKLWKYEGGQGVDYGGVRDLSLSPDASTLVCSGLIEASNPLGAVSIPAAVTFDWNSGAERSLHRPKESPNGVGWAVRFHPSGEFFVMASGGNGGGILWFFKPGQVNETHRFNLPNTARDMDLHPDGLRVATAHHDGHLRITAMHKKTG